MDIVLYSSGGYVKKKVRTSLVVQWLRICLPIQGTWVMIPDLETKISHAAEQLNPCTTSTKLTCSSPQAETTEVCARVTREVTTMRSSCSATRE